MWFEQGTLTYSCPETTRPVRTGIVADTATIEKLSFFKLSVWCPHCETPHTILGKQACISHSQDNAGAMELGHGAGPIDDALLVKKDPGSRPGSESPDG